MLALKPNLPDNLFRFKIKYPLRSILLLQLLLCIDSISMLVPDQNDPTNDGRTMTNNEIERNILDPSQFDLKSLKNHDHLFNDQRADMLQNHSFDIIKENTIQDYEDIYSDTSYQEEPSSHKYFDRSLAQRACQLDRGSQRSEELNNTYLTYCTRYKMENLFSNEILMSIMHEDSRICRKFLDEFIQLDELINQFDSLFKNLLRRYNCHNGYSVKWNCEDCKKAYKDWLCAVNLPYYMNGERIKPCISFCERVEQRCPYLHPITREQYGGQPVFICRDPNIPFIPEITPDIPYEEPTKCYDLCHIRHNSTELISDSLSKYEPSDCPDTSLLAESVRSDPHYLDQQRIPSGSLGTTEVNRTLPMPDDSNGSNSWSDIDASDDDIVGFGGIPSVPTRKPSTSPTKGTSSSSSSSSTVGVNKGTNGRIQEVHRKKLSDLREVLAVYKNQPRTHHFGHHSDLNSVNTSKSIGESIWARWMG